LKFSTRWGHVRHCNTHQRRFLFRALNNPKRLDAPRLTP